MVEKGSKSDSFRHCFGHCFDTVWPKAGPGTGILAKGVQKGVKKVSQMVSKRGPKGVPNSRIPVQWDRVQWDRVLGYGYSGYGTVGTGTGCGGGASTRTRTPVPGTTPQVPGTTTPVHVRALHAPTRQPDPLHQASSGFNTLRVRDCSDTVLDTLLGHPEKPLSETLCFATMGAHKRCKTVVLVVFDTKTVVLVVLTVLDSSAKPPTLWARKPTLLTPGHPKH